MCFDTAASNAESHKGTYILLEQKMDKKILQLPCRLHIMEIMLESFVQNELQTFSGEYDLLFKRFKKSWLLLNKEEFMKNIKNVKGKINCFCSKTTV